MSVETSQEQNVDSRPSSDRKIDSPEEFKSTHHPKIETRLKGIPKFKRSIYLRSVSEGRSRSVNIKAFCQMCVGYDETRNSIRNCTDIACPLYQVRPYQEKK